MTPEKMAFHARKLLLQTNPKINPEPRAYGCIWMDLLAVPQIWTEQVFTPEVINWMWEDDKKAGRLVKINGYWLALPENHHRIIENAYDRLTSRACQVSLVDVATFERGDLVGPSKHFNWWDGTRDFTILCGLTMPGGTHFRLGDNRAQEVYNTYPNLPLQKELQVRSYKIAIHEED